MPKAEAHVVADKLTKLSGFYESRYVLAISDSGAQRCRIGISGLGRMVNVEENIAF
jgi:hypothetical protein